MKSKIIACLLTVFALLSLLSCSSDNAAMEYEGATITVNEYRYMMSTYKYLFSKSYEGFEDTEEYYNKTYSDGTTYEKFLNDIAEYNIKVSLVTKQIFDSKGYSLKDEDTQKVDDYINGLLEKAGGKTELNAALKEYGINYEMLRSINLDSKKNDCLCEMLYEDGTLNISEGDKKEYLDGKYVHFLHLYISEDNKDKYESVIEELNSGKEFSEVYREYSDDRYYDYGYYLRSDSDFFTGVTEAVFNIGIGEYTEITTDYGIHIVYRLEPVEDAYNNDDYYDFFTDFQSSLKEYKYTEFINGKIDDIKVNEDVVSGYSIKNVPMNTKY